MRDRESTLVAYSWLIESVTVPKRFPRNFPPFDSHRQVTSNPYPDESVDLAAIPLRISTKDAGRESAPGVVLEQFASAEDIFEGASVIVLGFPGALTPIPQFVITSSDLRLGFPLIEEFAEPSVRMYRYPSYGGNP